MSGKRQIPGETRLRCQDEDPHDECERDESLGYDPEPEHPRSTACRRVPRFNKRNADWQRTSPADRPTLFRAAS